MGGTRLLIICWLPRVPHIFLAGSLAKDPSILVTPGVRLCAARAGEIGKVMFYMKEMQGRGLNPDVKTFTTAIQV